MTDFKNGKYVSELIEAGIKNETTEAYKVWEEASNKISKDRAAFLKPYKEALEKAEREFRNAADSLPEYPPPELHALWITYVDTSHKQGFPVWGIDSTDRDKELIEKLTQTEGKG